MKRLLVLTLIAICIAVLVFLGIRFFFPKGSEPINQGNNGTNFPIGGNNGGTNTGTDSPYRDIITDPDTVDVGSGSYIVAGGFDVTKNPPFQIVLYSPDNSFTVSLQELPLGATRLRAETELLSLTKLSQTELCTKPVMVNVPYDVSEQYSGRNLGLSFCAGAVTLP